MSSPPGTINGSQYCAGVPSARRRWVRVACPPQRAQTAVSLVTESAIARRYAIAGNGSPRKLVSSPATITSRSEEHTSELQSRENLVCRLLLEKKKMQRLANAT